jgi:hypothetical protein
MDNSKKKRINRPPIKVAHDAVYRVLEVQKLEEVPSGVPVGVGYKGKPEMRKFNAKRVTRA